MVYRIKELREERSMTQSKLAAISGVTRATLWKLESGEDVGTTTLILEKLANALNVPVEELFSK